MLGGWFCLFLFARGPRCGFGSRRFRFGLWDDIFHTSGGRILWFFGWLFADFHGFCLRGFFVNLWREIDLLACNRYCWISLVFCGLILGAFQRFRKTWFDGHLGSRLFRGPNRILHRFFVGRTILSVAAILVSFRGPGGRLSWVSSFPPIVRFGGSAGRRSIPVSIGRMLLPVSIRMVLLPVSTPISIFLVALLSLALALVPVTSGRGGLATGKVFVSSVQLAAAASVLRRPAPTLAA
mmetsp:Transcript_14421/g.33446  ORF Transcript_14421/g.33446 Transcript_14421/m.33446 type:complete len:238 (-) Transcript_14421:893-1606(-)